MDAGIVAGHLGSYVPIRFGTFLTDFPVLGFGLIDPILNQGHIVQHLRVLLEILLVLIAVFADEQFFQPFVAVQLHRADGGELLMGACLREKLEDRLVLQMVQPLGLAPIFLLRHVPAEVKVSAGQEDTFRLPLNHD